MSLEQITAELSDAVDALSFAAPITHVYNPLAYARAPHLEFLRRFGSGPKEAVFLGMNPGPWGMAQTGIPFGEVAAVRDWMGLDLSAVARPASEHPKRLVRGGDSPRSEVSGRRLWGWAAERFGTAEAFFARFAVVNYCPLSFMEESGRNFIPEKLPKAEREPLFEVCDRALVAMVEEFRTPLVIGIGAFARKRAATVCQGLDVRIGQVLHPSPASPAANRGWAPQAEAQLLALGVSLP